jgi:hypothetical protein
MPWDWVGKRGQEKSRKALISLGFTAFLGLPGKTKWWSRGDLNPKLQYPGQIKASAHYARNLDLLDCSQ